MKCIHTSQSCSVMCNIIVITKYIYQLGVVQAALRRRKCPEKKLRILDKRPTTPSRSLKRSGKCGGESDNAIWGKDYGGIITRRNGWKSETKILSARDARWAKRKCAGLIWNSNLWKTIRLATRWIHRIFSDSSFSHKLPRSSYFTTSRCGREHEILYRKEIRWIEICFLTLCNLYASRFDSWSHSICNYKDSLPWPRLEISLKYFPCLISERGWKVLLIFIKNRCSVRLHTKSIIFNPRETVVVQEQQHKKVAAQKARRFVIKM